MSGQFGIGVVRQVRHLPKGLMNDNWRIEADAGTFALKKIRDVPLDTARRNLRTLTALAEAGVPVPSPLLTPAADPVAEAGQDGFSLLSWIEGRHRRGADLALPEVTVLGALLGRLHEILNRRPATTGLPPAIDAPTASVTAPGTALAQIDRYLTHLADLDKLAPFDEEAAHFLVQRRLLLEKYADERPALDVPAGPFGWTHGDFQHRNVLWRAGEVVAVLDWDRIRVRPFGEEAVRTATVQFGGADGLLDLERVAAFMDGYRSVIAISPAELEDAVSRLWWKRMTAGTRRQRADHSLPELRADVGVRAERRGGGGHPDRSRPGRGPVAVGPAEGHRLLAVRFGTPLRHALRAGLHLPGRRAGVRPGSDRPGVRVAGCSPAPGNTMDAVH